MSPAPAGWKACATRNADILVCGFGRLSSRLSHPLLITPVPQGGSASTLTEPGPIFIFLEPSARDPAFGFYEQTAQTLQFPSFIRSRRRTTRILLFVARPGRG